MMSLVSQFLLFCTFWVYYFSQNIGLPVLKLSSAWAWPGGDIIEKNHIVTSSAKEKCVRNLQILNENLIFLIGSIWELDKFQPQFSKKKKKELENFNCFIKYKRIFIMT